MIGARVRRLNLKKEDILKPIARENMSKGGKGLTTLTNLNTRETIAKVSNVSEGTISKVKFIESKADEETKKKLSCSCSRDIAYA